MKDFRWFGFFALIFLVAPNCVQAFGDMRDVSEVCAKLPPQTVLFLLCENAGQTASAIETSSIGKIWKHAKLDEVFASSLTFAEEFRRNVALEDDFSLWESIKESRATVWLAVIEVDGVFEVAISIEQHEPSKLEKTIASGVGWKFDSEVFKSVNIQKLQFSNACMFSWKEQLYFTSSVKLAKKLIDLDSMSATENLAATRKFQRCAKLQQSKFDLWCYCDPTVIARLSGRNLRENSPAVDDRFMANNLGEILAVFGSLTFANTEEASSELFMAEIQMLLAVPNRRFARLLAFKETDELDDTFVVPANCDAVARISFDLAELFRGAEETVDSTHGSNTFRSQFVGAYKEWGIDVEDFLTRQLTGGVTMYYRQSELNKYVGIASLDVPLDFAIDVGDEEEARDFLAKLHAAADENQSRELVDVQGVPVWRDKEEARQRLKENLRVHYNREMPVPELILAAFNQRISMCYSIEDMKANLDAWQEKKTIDLEISDWRRVDKAITRLAGKQTVSTRIYFRNGVQYKYFYEYLKSGNAISTFIDYSYPPKLVNRFVDLQKKLRELPDSKDLLEDIPAAGAFISGNPREGHIAFTFFELNGAAGK